MTPLRTTLRDVAQALGLHHTTVSRALNGDPRISPATRQRVAEAVERLGYRPDPVLSALMAYRSRLHARSFQGVLAWVTNYSTADGWKAFERSAYFAGAQRRAAELGYTIEEFWLRAPDITPQRATQILRARNVRGLFFIPQPRSRAHLRLDWKHFASITFGRTLAWPVLHNVHTDHFRSFSKLMRQIKRLGYKRPGYAVWARIHESVDRLWAGAFSTFQSLPLNKQVPLFVPKIWSQKKFESWFLKYRPDVIISNDEIIMHWLDKLGLRVPDDVGFALGAKHAESSAHCAGVRENNELVGEVAVNVLVDMANRNTLGIPDIPISTLVEGTFSPGSTLRPQTVGPLPSEEIVEINL